MPGRVGSVALLLHAHLPYVRHPEHAHPLEERWLHEALWECYLPLLGVLDRLEKDGVHAPFTLSLSPPLLALLQDPLLRARFEDHLHRVFKVAQRECLRFPQGTAFGPPARFYVARLEELQEQWRSLRGDVVGAFLRHAEAGRLELWTSAATHAYLPGLLPSRASIRAQLRLGLRSFEERTGSPARGLWLPECAYHPSFDEDLAQAGVRASVLDAHALELARPCPESGIFEPIRSPSGVAFFGRDPLAAREVWSRRTGYPGDPLYREFYRDVGFERDEGELEGHVGPHGTRVMTGIKLHRITGSEAKAPYDREAALARAAEDAIDFVACREEDLLEASAAGIQTPVTLTPYDAELFGHWWFEGPDFLETVLRTLDLTAKQGRLRATTPGAYLAALPKGAALPVVEPGASSWGEGGYGEVWTGPAAAPVWRHVHHAHRAVEKALESSGFKQGAEGRALEQALRELMLLQSSDWPFMLHRGEMATYAEGRVRAHLHRTLRLVRLAEGGVQTEEDASFLREVEARDRLFAELKGEALRDAFDDWL